MINSFLFASATAPHYVLGSSNSNSTTSTTTTATTTTLNFNIPTLDHLIQLVSLKATTRTILNTLDKLVVQPIEPKTTWYQVRASLGVNPVATAGREAMYRERVVGYPRSPQRYTVGVAQGVQDADPSHSSFDFCLKQQCF